MKAPTRSPRTAELIDDTLRLWHIYEQTEEFGDDCLIWTGTLSQNGYPIMKIWGGPCLLVRRFVVQHSGDKFGKTVLKPRQPVGVTCTEKLCVNPRHLKASTCSEIGIKAAARGAFSTMARRAKIAAAKRKDCKLNEVIAREIFLSTESGPVLAARHQVNRSLINSIKRGEAWRDYSSPFAGLGARA